MEVKERYEEKKWGRGIGMMKMKERYERRESRGIEVEEHERRRCG